MLCCPVVLFVGNTSHNFADFKPLNGKHLPTKMPLGGHQSKRRLPHINAGVEAVVFILLCKSQTALSAQSAAWRVARCLIWIFTWFRALGVQQPLLHFGGDHFLEPLSWRVRPCSVAVIIANYFAPVHLIWMASKAPAPKARRREPTSGDDRAL